MLLRELRFPLFFFFFPEEVYNLFPHEQWLRAYENLYPYASWYASSIGVRWLMLHGNPVTDVQQLPSPLAPPKDSSSYYPTTWMLAAVLPGGEIIVRKQLEPENLDLRYLAKTDSDSLPNTRLNIAPFELCLFLTYRPILAIHALQAGYANWYKELMFPTVADLNITPLQLPVDVVRIKMNRLREAYNQLINPEPVTERATDENHGRRLMLTNGAPTYHTRFLSIEFVRHFGDALYGELLHHFGFQQNEFIEYTSPVKDALQYKNFEFRFVFKWGRFFPFGSLYRTNFDAWEAIRVNQDGFSLAEATRIRPFLPRTRL
ncbi:hypothetical protein SPFM15_00288 [Salmonella phage SPFM15]|nr:hypothetical protein SPFM15_00288 [Salmonella phage SPFM15]